MIAQGLAEPHHLLPHAGWVSCFLRRPEDVDHAIALLERSHALAVSERDRRQGKIEADANQA